MKLFNRVSRIRSRCRKRPAFHLNFELCEDRVLLAILVTTPDDNGDNFDPTPGSLRQAILTANSTPGQDTIDFNIPGSGPFIIQPLTALPTITDQVNLDGTTERTFLGLPAAGPPVIQLNGNGLPGDGLVLGSAPPGESVGGTSSAGSTIIGLNIYNFTGGAGIHIQTNGNLVTGNFLGTDVNGTAAGPGNGEGVVIDSTASNNTIGGTGAGAGNVISGNSVDGIDIGSFSPTLSSANGNLVQGNKIGTNAAGTAELTNAAGTTEMGNGSAGVRFVDGISNTVENNVISGNVNEGIFFHGNDGASDEMVLGNLVGTNAAGTAPIGNGLSGITLQQSAANTIGGNVISGNGVGPFGGNGITLAGADDNLIQANLIGTDASGTRALPNISDGVFVSGSIISNVFVSSSNNTIGGTTDNDRNVISGNGNDGVEMTSGESNNTVLGNFIGVGADGTTPLGNVLDGVSIASGATSNTIGGTAVGAGNVISGNGNDGVEMISGESNNAVLGNYIGVGADGTTPLGNVLDGISLNNASSNSIMDNVVSDNGINQDAAGINLEASDLNSIAGNKIGTDMSGNKALGNSLHGIFLGDGSSNNTIGGTGAGAAQRDLRQRHVPRHPSDQFFHLVHSGGRGGLHLRCEHVGQRRAEQLHRDQRRRHCRPAQLGHRGVDLSVIPKQRAG